MMVLIRSLIIFALAIINWNRLGVICAPVPYGSEKNASAYGIYQHAAVAADNGVCSDIGNSILMKGGNAVDAIIATAICIGVMDTHSSGLGGGHFMNFYNKQTRQCIIFDARERAPSSVDEDVYRNNSRLTKFGWLAIAVPGEVHGFWTAYKTYGGKVPWRDLWTPTINLCRKGFEISPALAKALRDEAVSIENSTYFGMFINPQTGKVKGEGETVTMPLLADTMEKLANSDQPDRLFYDSNWTDSIIAEISKNGGIISREDMKNYRTRFGDKARPAIYTHLKNGLSICAPPPPSSGALTSSVINILDGYNITANMKNNGDNLTLFYHLFVESLKFAYGERMKLGDIDYVPSAYHITDSVSYPGYGLMIRRKIKEKSVQDPTYYGADPPPPDAGTSHIAVVDQYGNAASLTTSINMYFGSKMRSQVTGITYNNEMDDFSIPGSRNSFDVEPTPENRMAPGKRPQSSMSPLIAFDRTTGRIEIVLGAAGGIKIIAAVAHVLMRVLYFKEPICQAIDAPRIYNQLNPFSTTTETEFPRDIFNRLASEYDQQMSPIVSPFLSVVCGIHRLPNGLLEASSDYRKGGGYPAGF